MFAKIYQPSGSISKINLDTTEGKEFITMIKNCSKDIFGEHLEKL
jgi:hypothetical protein